MLLVYVNVVPLMRKECDDIIMYYHPSKSQILP